MGDAHWAAGTPKLHCETYDEIRVHDYGAPATGRLVGGAVNGCDYSLDMWVDGHYEWAAGGAFLAADDGDSQSYGALVCYGEVAHHPPYGIIDVDDNSLDSQFIFRVYADTLNNLPPTDPSAPNCGDGESDQGITCVDWCAPLFPPGLDGLYVVYVVGTEGHVRL